MSLRVKTFDEIVMDMIDWVVNANCGLTDFNTGSTSRTMLEAVAWALKDLYGDAFITFRTALKDFIYDAFGFAAQQALKAGGHVRFNSATPPVSDIIIPIGTLLETADSVGFTTTEQGVLPAGLTVTADIPVSATVAGASGNVKAGTITSMVTSIAGLTGVNNVLPTTGGADFESDADKQYRFRKYVLNLARCTKHGIEAGAETVSGVYQAQLAETGTRGLLHLYVDDGTGTCPPALLNDVQFIIEGNGTPEYPGYRGAGTVIMYFPAVTVPVTIVQTVYVKRGADTAGVKSMVESKQTTLINSYRMGVDLRLEAIRSEGKKVAEVLDVVLTSPGSDVSINDGQVVKVSSITTTIVEVDE